MSKQQKIVLIGAGSLQFGLGAAGNIINSDILEGSTICLHDINEEKLGLITQACKAAIEKDDLNYTLESTTDLTQALENATFIINSIEVGPRFKLWDQDYEIPRKYGNKQVYGENGGPGGMFHSLRIIPPILEICGEITKMCPDAFLINFSNPMSRICLAIHKKYPNLNFVGLCHEYHHHLPIIAKIIDADASNLEVKAGGLNHFGVVLDIRYKDTGEDAYPDIREKGSDFLNDLNTLDGNNIMKFILEQYGYIPYTTDSHFGEYLHWAWDVVDMEGIKRFKEAYKQSLAYENKKIERLIRKGKGARLVEPDKERAIPIIEGILTDSKHREASVNIPNDDIIPNLSEELVIECPAIVNKDGLKGVPLGEYPEGLAALLTEQGEVQKLVVDTVLSGKKETALQALLADPVVNSYSAASKMLDEILEKQKEYITLE
ncbi:MAG: alpha-glucosidase [Promethearchaeia archaeon]